MNPVYLIVIVVFVALAFVFSQAQARKTAGATREFLDQHSDALKVYLAGKFGIVTESVYVATVDGEPAHLFTEGGALGIPGFPGSKSGVYVLPGKRTLELQYTHNRPGVIYKNVSTSTGLVKKEFVFEAGKRYHIGFDRKEETFSFEEYQG
jgi:hypothetical protein